MAHIANMVSSPMENPIPRESMNPAAATTTIIVTQISRCWRKETRRSSGAPKTRWAGEGRSVCMMTPTASE